jgi:O-antigen/teichoic acid export membrane protein
MVAFAFTFRYNHPIFYGELIFTFGLVFQHAFFDWYFICGKFWKRLFVSKLLHTISYSAVMFMTLLYFKIERIELIALAMVLAALPAFFYGVTQAFHAHLLKITRRTFRFIALMVKAGIPYAISSFAAFAYLPIGLYVADKFASAEFLGCYNFGHKILVLCSGIMVHFISSNLITLHSTHDKNIHLKDIAVFTLFIAVCSSPLWLFPSWILKILFFAAPWTDATLQTSANILRILSLSLIFQAARTTLISTLLKEHATRAYAIMVSIGGASNVIACGLAGMYLENAMIPLFALTGDLVITVILFGYFTHHRRVRW